MKVFTLFVLLVVVMAVSIGFGPRIASCMVMKVADLADGPMKVAS